MRSHVVDILFIVNHVQQKKPIFAALILSIKKKI